MKGAITVILYEKYNTPEALQLLKQMSFLKSQHSYTRSWWETDQHPFAPFLSCMLKSSLKHSSLEMGHFVNVFVLF